MTEKTQNIQDWCDEQTIQGEGTIDLTKQLTMHTNYTEPAKHPKTEILSYIDSWIADKTHRLIALKTHNKGVDYTQEIADIYNEGLLQGEYESLKEIRQQVEDAFHIDPFIDGKTIATEPLTDKIATLNPTDREKLVASLIDDIIRHESLFFSDLKSTPEDPDHYYVKGRIDCIENIYHQIYYIFRDEQGNVK